MWGRNRRLHFTKEFIAGTNSDSKPEYGEQKMGDRREIDLKAAINAISDVVQNRPRPLRELDQIYMKTGDMVLQSELVAHWANGKRLAFIGDGDAISVCVAYLKQRGIVDYGPSKIVVFDFDERICSAVERFADRERLDQLQAVGADSSLRSKVNIPNFGDDFSLVR